MANLNLSESGSSTCTLLHFCPKWNEMGDPDNPLMAVAYGFIALLIVWYIEDLAELFLFRMSRRITLSDLGALVTFRSSTWIELSKWMLMKPSNTRLSRKAFLGVFLRFLITLAEILVLFASLPRSVPVYESQVLGSTEVSFLPEAKFIQQTRAQQGIVPQSCHTDKNSLDGFTPTVVRQVCLSARTMYGASERFTATLKSFPNGTEMYVIAHVPEKAALVIVSTRSGVTYEFTHSITYRNLSKSFAQDKVYLYPMPEDIVLQATNEIRLIAQLNKTCGSITLISNESALLVCTPTPTQRIEQPFKLPQMLFKFMGTRAINHSKSKLVGDNRFNTTSLQIGFVNRPRLCIFPSLILLACLLMVSTLSKLWLPGRNVNFELWKILSRPWDSDSCNPLFPGINHHERNALEDCDTNQFFLQSSALVRGIRT